MLANIKESKFGTPAMHAEDQNQRIQELFLLQRVAQRINAILDLDVLLEEVVNDVARTFGYSRSAVLLKDDATNELVIAAVRGWTINYHVKGDRFKIGVYGMVGHAAEIGETYYAPDVTVDPYYQISEASTRSELDIPLKVHGRRIGIFDFQHQEPNAFSADRIQLLEALAAHVATAIENARLFQHERQEKERMAKELDEARRVQLALFPDRAPDLAGFEVTGLCLPCQEVGGDWYDYIPLQDGRLALALADVSGKGMAAALLMASTRSILRLFAERGLPPGEVLQQVNRVLVQDFPRAKFVTMIYAVIDPARQSIVIANAGHLPPLFVDTAASRFLEIDPGLPLGIQEVSFPEYRLDMPAGSRLLLYSDGVSEAMNSSLEEYGAMRLRDQMAKPSASVQNILDDVRAFAGGYPACDDRTVVMIKTL